MNAFDIIRAWKDEAFRASLTDAQRATLPASPAGMIELSETDLDLVAGGALNCVPPRTSMGGGCPRTSTGTNKPTRRCTKQ
jgi:mersacidin/lichenicidin family type 2 lantibiotic